MATRGDVHVTAFCDQTAISCPCTAMHELADRIASDAFLSFEQASRIHITAPPAQHHFALHKEFTTAEILTQAYRDAIRLLTSQDQRTS